MSRWELFVEVPGEPIAKGRPRFNRRTGTAYTPPKTAKYENLVKLAFQEQNPGWVPTEEPVAVFIRAQFPPLKSWSRKQNLIARLVTIWKTTAPDIDNLVKAAFDGLNGTAWKSDAQVARLEAVKFYDEQPRMTIRIVPLEGEELRSLRELNTKQLEKLVEAEIRLEDETNG